MANNKIINTRILSKIDTSSEWSRLDPVLLNGEKIVVDFGTGAHPRYREKIGDGQSKYSQLPFIDENGVSVSLYDDDVVNLEHADGSTGPKYTTNSVSIVGKHHEEYNDSHGKRIEYDSSNTTSAIGPGETKVIKLPQFKVNEYGHVIEAEDSDIIIEVPNAPSVGDIVEGLGSGVEYLGVVSSLIGLTTTASKGDFYRVVVEFTSGNVTAHVGDLVVAEVDNPTRNIFESSEDAAADNGWVVIHCHSDTDSDTQSFLSTTNDTTKGVLTLTEKDKLGNTIRTDNVNIVEDGIINVKSDGNNNITISTKNITLGETDKSISTFNGQAKANYSIATGSNDKSSIIPIVGETLANKIEVNNPISSGVGSIASGAGAEATSAGAIAVGSLTRVGVQGFYWSDIIWNDDGSATITLSTKQGSADWTNAPTIDWVAKKNGLAGIGDYVGDRISIVNDAKYPACATIINVNTANHKITVDKLPFTEKKTPSMVLPDDYTIFACGRIDITTGNTELDSTSDLIHSRWYPRSGSVTVGWASAAFGVENLISGSAAFSAGWNNWSAGDFGATFGRDNISGYASVVGGTQNNASATNTIVGGSTNTVKGNASMVAGQGSTIESGNVLACGANHSITNNSSCTTVGGDGNILTNSWCSAVFGNKNTADGQFNIIGGKNNKSQSHCNVLSGEDNIITGNDSAIFGQGNTSNGSQTLITGLNNKIATSCGETAVFGNGNAVGSDEAVTKPDGSSAKITGITNILVGGKNNKAYASCTTVGGQANIAWAGNAAMFGYNNVAKSYSTFLAGDGNISTRGCQAVFGQYNDPTSTLGDLLVVGNGANSSSEKAGYTAETTNTGGTHYVKRSNAFRVTSAGNTIIAGKATVGANPTADMDVATKKYVDENAGTKVDFSNVEIGVLSVGRRADDGETNYDGMKNTVSNWSLGVGRKLTLNNSQSISVGYNNTNSSSCTITVGEALTTTQYCGAAFGKYNKITNALLVVGKGSSSSPSDAFIVQTDGRATVGKDPVNNLDVATKQYVDSHSGGVSIDSFDAKYFKKSGNTITLDLSVLLEQEW